MKAAIVVFSDPKSGSEESLGRVFNALAAAYDFKQKGDDVRILFHGAGTRWVGELTKGDHPAHALFRSRAGQGGGRLLWLCRRIRRYGRSGKERIRASQGQSCPQHQRAAQLPQSGS